VFASTSFGEKGVEGIVTATDRLVGRHLAIGLNAVLEAEKLPARVTSLNTGLANMDSDTLSHFD
jgi:demethoxyubiquinone hydroxylase (CLK1/Coq7/Cat5 family)